MFVTATKTVLLVIADPGLGRDATAVLERRGFRVMTAASHDEALDVLVHQRVRPQLIVLDWALPGGDAQRFLTRHASSPGLAFIPLVVLAWPLEERVVPTLCVASVVTKPIRGLTLVEVVTRLAGIHLDFDDLSDGGGLRRELGVTHDTTDEITIETTFDS